jgi:hypothetical protein
MPEPRTGGGTRPWLVEVDKRGGEERAAQGAQFSAQCSALLVDYRDSAGCFLLTSHCERCPVRTE